MTHLPISIAGQAVTALEKEAGIDQEAERARNVFVGFPHSDLPSGSRASLEEGRLERKLEHESVSRRIRAVYFAVSDIELRKRLIVAYRQVDQARHLAAANSVQAARNELYARIKTGSISAGDVIGVPLSAAATWAAYTWGGLAAALALIAALIATIPSSVSAESRRRGAAIRKAEDELQFAEECAEEAFTLGVVFSRSEERAGEPDPRA